ncbi:MAG TPA: tetratricopeptide repeat protein [Candidatus Coprenecus pullistercoris]|nr:tetratricopeptide repeat protein [Candidatus Coprenecus pullistercoris]
MLMCVSGAAMDYGRNLERVRELFDNGMYAAARAGIDRAAAQDGLSALQESELATYGIICDIRLSAPDLEALIKEYAERYRYAPGYMGVMLQYASSLFDRGEYEASLDVLDSVDYAQLSRADKEQYLYLRSYCQLRVGLVEEAANGFRTVLDGRHNKYTVPATFYMGYIVYLNRDFEKAVELFSQISGDGRFKEQCAYYVLESKLMLGDYEYVVDNGAAVMEAVHEDMRPKVARMMSQAYYGLGRPEEARKWFRDYSDAGSDMTRKDSYYLGIISYSLGSYYQAVEAFSKVVGTEDTLGQSACMHMANSYLKLKNKHEALKYYRMASEVDFDSDIQEESYYNYAKLAFDVNSDISVFQDYLAKWPQTEKSDEIYSYIATSYLLSKQYKAAIDALNRIHVLTPQMDVNLQKAAFLRAVELFGRGSYGGAGTDFRIALRHSSYNPTLGLLAKFWLAETCYRAGDIDEAISLYSSLCQSPSFRSFKEYPLVPFGLGYCYFSNREYASAAMWFHKFLEEHYQDMALVIEARLRIGDALFMQKDYAGAAAVYEEVSMVNYLPEYVVYAAYQCALSYGLIQDTDRKIGILEGIMDDREDTPVYSRAVYELGRTYVQEGMTDKAERCFKYLLNEVKDPLYAGKCLLEIGMLYSNAGDYDEALSYLTEIVEDMPLSEDTGNALAVIESIYTVQNKPEEYFAYLDRLGLSAVKTSDEKELMMFNAVEQIYLSGDYKSALKSLRSFIEQYPDGEKTPAAYFYLGESLYATGSKEAAAEAYAEVMDKGQGAFVELSTLQYARISYELEKYGKAASSYERLLSIAVIDNNRYLARKGMMEAYYMDGKYNSAIDAASDLLGSKPLTEQDRKLAMYITAKSSLMLGDREAAVAILKELSADNFTAHGAEAAYLLVQDAYDAGEFEEVENLVYAFADSQTDQRYWLAKSFIVLGDSFAERENWAQAKATFESVRDGYVPRDGKDDVLEQVNMRLKRLDKLTEDL